MSPRATVKALRGLGGIAATYDEDFGEFRVTLAGLAPRKAEAVAYYTADSVDALDTARAMLAVANA